MLSNLNDTELRTILSIMEEYDLEDVKAECLHRFRQTHSGKPTSAAVTERLRRLAAGSTPTQVFFDCCSLGKIPAIKLVRETLGCPLVDAKEYVEQHGLWKDADIPF